ncbi:Spy/CpxP family protein refolding chaperone [Pseudotenacibaculum haliotis]|uniref:Spy/CpxP family protein refolding chaperone n=1 Tax=Pseudotenacibaculum haliotis TaxID=1862138 RepID=A0ABW5LNV5_9FLAO
MRKKLLYAFLLIMLIINALLLYMILDKKMGKQPQKGPGFLTEELNFTEEQKDRFFMLDRVHRREMMQLDDELRDLRKKLFNSFAEEGFSPDSITSRIGELEEAKQKEMYAFFKEVRSLCDEDQAKIFDKIIDKVLRRRGPKKPGPDRRGPPGPPERDF